MCMGVRLVAVCGNLIFDQTARSSERFRARSRRSLPPSATPTVSLADRITSQPFHPRLPYVSCHHAVMVTALLCTAQPEKRYRSHVHTCGACVPCYHCVAGLVVPCLTARLTDCLTGWQTDAKNRHWKIISTTATNLATGTCVTQDMHSTARCC
jgi:hypothetical protein